MTTDRLSRLIRDMKGAGSAVVVMSPHLDDAVLSCGALLAHLAARHLITVATVFTAAAPPPWSLPARRQLRALGGVDAEAFFAQRRAEDRDVLAGIGVAAVHLGFRDALFRRGRRGPAYPTFRFDAARGRVASCDARLAAELAEHGFAGTFYVAPRSAEIPPGRRLSPATAPSTRSSPVGGRETTVRSA